MKSTRWSAFAAAFVGTALACGIYILRQPEPARTATELAAKTKAQASGRSRSGSQARAGLTAEDRGQSLAGGRNHRSQIQATAPAAAPLPIRKVLGAPPAGGTPVLSESQWRAAAAKVEMEANHELNRLARLLDLDSAQQDKVFAALAQHSPHWTQGMQTSAGGTATAAESAATSDVSAYLSADQQQTLVQDEMDRQSWWEEVLPQLLPPTLQSDGTVTSDPASAVTSDSSASDTNPVPETKAFEGDGMLLEE